MKMALCVVTLVLFQRTPASVKPSACSSFSLFRENCGSEFGAYGSFAFPFNSTLYL